MSTIWDSLPNSEQIINTNPQKNSQHDTRIACDCGVNISQDQEEKHRKSKHHLSNTTKTAGLLASRRLCEYECKSCGTHFTNNELFENHLRTKTHRRNESRLVRNTGEKVDSEVISQFSRKKYKPRQQDKMINYQEKNYYLELQSYVHALVAYMSLRLAFDRNISDFYIATDDLKYQSYGDIVIKLKRNKGKEEKKIIYAIKFKQISKSNKKIGSLGEAKINLSKEYECLSKLKKIAEFGNTNFCIFTTCTATSKFRGTEEVDANVLKHWKKGKDINITSEVQLVVKPFTKRNEYLNMTTDPENVFTVYPKEETDEFDLPTMFIYTSQKVFPGMLRDIMKNTFEKRQMFNREIGDYIKYVKDWSEGKLGGHHYLNRYDVILKIGEIFLTPYVAVPSKTVNLMRNDFKIWNKVIESVDLIMMKNEPSIMSKICEPFNTFIENTLEERIDEISNSMRPNTDLLQKISSDPMMKAYFFEEVDLSKREPGLPISKLYRMFWKSGRIPLLLTTELFEDDKDFLLDVMSLMKDYGVTRKFIILTADPFFANSSCKLKIFSRLEDVKETVNLTEVGLKIATNAYNLTLEEICKTDQFFLKWVTPNIFFDIALGNYHFKTDRSRKEGTISDMKITLNDDTIQEIRNLLHRDEAAATETPIGIDKGRLRGIDPDLFKMMKEKKSE
ncbi:unnamed protein product [Phaedon cochleariae]|uniref:C2H2-type domain-containing protein n=1 Tax=Phaedon cochleariae TaxID=80249 RepID=A0A9P0DP53_PHACE|nr:unnamed protein product [Phaedon cochleariae]